MPQLIDIGSIREDTLEMGQLAVQAMINAVRSLNDRDVDLAEKVIGGDAEIDRLEFAIENRCMEAFESDIQGKHLRTVAATYRFIVDLERIGDYSVSISNVTRALANKPVAGLELKITRMADIAAGMLRRSMEAYDSDSAADLKSVFDDDLEIDRLYGEVFYNGLAEIVHEPETATNIVYVIIASRALERIGDHITDIAERVEFIGTGKLAERSVPMHVPPDLRDANWG